MSWPKHKWKEFADKIEKRLEVGAEEYGDKSFSNPAIKTIDDILEELMDVVGWTFILSVRVNDLRSQLEEWEKSIERRVRKGEL